MRVWVNRWCGSVRHYGWPGGNEEGVVGKGRGERWRELEYQHYRSAVTPLKRSSTAPVPQPEIVLTASFHNVLNNPSQTLYGPDPAPANAANNEGEIDVGQPLSKKAQEYRECGEDGANKEEKRKADVRGRARTRSGRWGR